MGEKKRKKWHLYNNDILRIKNNEIKINKGYKFDE